MEMAVKLADRIVRLVAAKEKQGTGISTSYLQQYIKGETGICCENKRKFGKIKEALIALGFIKVLRQGRHRCGATYYGLAGRLAETEQPSEKRLPVNEGQLDGHLHGEPCRPGSTRTWHTQSDDSRNFGGVLFMRSAGMLDPAMHYLEVSLYSEAFGGARSCSAR